MVLSYENMKVGRGLEKLYLNLLLAFLHNEMKFNTHIQESFLK